MTMHEDYEQWLHQIIALENHWQSCGNMTTSEIIRYEQLKGWIRNYEQEQRNVPVRR